MRKWLLAATVLAPLLVAPALAGGGIESGAVSGNLTGTASMSTGGVVATQGTQAAAMTSGNGASFQRAMAGNAASIATAGTALAGPGNAMTGSNTVEAQHGGTTVMSNGKAGRFGVATGNVTAGQTTSVAGGSVAAASNLHGLVGVTMNKGHGPR